MATIADLVIKLSANTASAEKDITSFSSKVSRGFGKALLPAVGVLGGVGLAAKKAADAARDLGESQNAVNVVFGDAAGKISAFAKVADKEAGLSMRQLNELVTPIGAMLQNMGDSADVAAEKSVNLAKRAADMASVFNVDVSEALQAIQAGLRGESDPLERFGVGLSDAAVRAKAVEMGLAKTAAAVTDAGRAKARYALILEQTAKLEGDFVATSDSAANAARVNAAAQENLRAKIGNGVLPIVQMYQSVIASATKWMSEHTQVVKIAAVVIGSLAGGVILVNGAMMVYRAGAIAVAAATGVWTAATWALNIAMRANPIVLLVTLIAGLVAAIVIAWQRCETFREIVTAAWEKIKAVTETVFNFIVAFFRRFWPLLLTIATGGLGLIIVLIIRNWEKVKTTTLTIFNAIVGFFRTWWPLLLAVMTGGMSLIVALIIRNWNTIKTTTSTIFNAITGFFRTWWPVLLAVMTGGISLIVGLVIRNWNTIKSTTSSVWNGVKSVVVGVLNTIRSVATAVFKALGTLINAAAKVVAAGAAAVKAALAPIITALDAVASAARIAKEAIDAVVSAGKAIASVPGKVGGAVGGAIDKIPGLAHGTPHHSGGLAVVGERGPELVNLPRGSRVFSNRDSRDLLAGGSGGPVIGAVHVHNDADVEVLARRVARHLAFAR